MRSPSIRGIALQQLQEVAAFREIGIFFAVSLSLLAFIFGDALIGRSLLAPVDIAPALWAQYRFVDPESNGVPQNHFVADQLAYDLPLQHLMHEAWRRGEIPWWNPYSYGGRPLLADAHCNGFDPIRILIYLVVHDFATAYNWVRASHCLWGSLGLFLLLRRSGNAAWLAGALALAGQFAGWKVQLFGHPWVEGALCWYPWLWLFWSGDLLRWRSARNFGGSVCVAAILLAGNLQSHAFLPLFAFAVAWGRARFSGQAWKGELRTLGGTLMLGTLLAAPLLFAEVELFIRNTRPVGGGVAPFPAWHIPLAFCAVHPWLLGTPRTGAYMTLGVGAFGFALWAGSAILPFSAIGLRGESGLAEFRRTAIVLVIGYLTIVATPLYSQLYARYAGIPVLGLLILAGNGVRNLIDGWRPPRWFRISFVGVALLVTTFGDAFGHFIFPGLRGAYAARLQARAASDGYGGRSASLRAAQADAVPAELSLRNPEVAAAILALLASLAVMTSKRPVSSHVCGLVLLLNLFAPAIHARRLIPRSSVEHLHRLVSGSEDHRALINRANGTGRFALRLEEGTNGHQKRTGDSAGGFFPYEIAALYRLHVVHGYAALVPLNACLTSGESGAVNADLTLWDNGRLTENPRRFQIEGPAIQPQVVTESLNSIEVAVPAASGARLIWRDTVYPGWRAVDANTGQPLTITTNALSSRIELPKGTRVVRLVYRPTHWNTGLLLAGMSGVILFVTTMNRPMRSQG